MRWRRLATAAGYVVALAGEGLSGIGDERKSAREGGPRGGGGSPRGWNVYRGGPKSCVSVEPRFKRLPKSYVGMAP